MVTKTILKSALALTLAATFPTFCIPANGQNSKTLRRSARTGKDFADPGLRSPPSWTRKPTHAPTSISLPAANSRRSIQFPGICRCMTSSRTWMNTIASCCMAFWSKLQLKTSGRSTDEQKIGDYYSSCMNTSAINADGLKPLQPELDRIDALKDKKELPALLAHYQKISVNAFLRSWLHAGL